MELATSSSEGTKWLEFAFKSLSNKVESKIFHDGDVGEIFDSLYGDEGEASAAVSLTVTMISCLVQLCDGIDDILSSIFPWYDYLEADGQLGALAHLIAHHVVETQDASPWGPTPLCASSTTGDGIFTIPPQQARGVPLSFLPLSIACQMGEPPKYGTLPDAKPPQHQVVKIFLSHRWAEPDTPNLDQDWNRLLDLLDRLVDEAILCCLNMLRIDFPFECIQKNTGGDELSNLPDTYLEVEGTSLDDSLPVATITSDLVLDLLTVVIDEMKKDGAPERVKANVAKRIWIWYDYCSLPQKPNRTPQELARFKKSLAQLPMIQRFMHTLIINTTQSYFKRAWCVAEWTNAGGCSIWDRANTGSLPNHDMDNGQTFQTFQLTLAWVALLDPSIDPGSVLTCLGLKFTDDVHQVYANSICWILWEASFRLKLFLHDLKPRVCMGCGSKSETIQWLKVIDQSMETDPSHDLEAWIAARNRPPMGASSQVEVIFAVSLDDGQNLPMSLFKTVVEAAIEKLARDETIQEETCVAVYLQRAEDISKSDLSSGSQNGPAMRKRRLYSPPMAQQGR